MKIEKASKITRIKAFQALYRYHRQFGHLAFEEVKRLCQMFRCTQDGALTFTLELGKGEGSAVKEALLHPEKILSPGVLKKLAVQRKIVSNIDFQSI